MKTDSGVVFIRLPRPSSQCFNTSSALMTITERLECVRLEFPECKTVAYADISTNMVLSTSAEIALRQEHINSLCNTAVEMLGGHSTSQLRNVLGEGRDTDVFQVIIIEPTEVGIFLRSTMRPTEALCCVCSPSIKLGPFLAGARRHLDKIGQDR